MAILARKARIIFADSLLALEPPETADTIKLLGFEGGAA
jgi:hypothetical protein